MLNQFLQRQFCIPFYQRPYSWKKKHVDDLLGDFSDAVARKKVNQNARPHYLANFVLMQRDDRPDRVDIIDGQQRLTSIILLLRAISLSFGDELAYQYRILQIENLIWPLNFNREFILVSPSRDNHDVEFLEQLLKDQHVQAVNTTQRNMKSRFGDLRAALNKADNDLDLLLSTILESEVTEHSVNDSIEANRIFLSLNARGKPLTNFDKVKALLIYYAEKIGETDLAKEVSRRFSDIAWAYERADQIIVKEGIKVRADGRLDEDVLLGWHYCVIEKLKQLVNAETVFLKLSRDLKDQDDPAEIAKFIDDYSDSAVSFFEHFAHILGQSTTNVEYYLGIAMCRFTSLAWPLLIVLSQRQLLDKCCQIETGSISLFRLMQITEKVHRRTQAQGQGLVELAYDVYRDPNILEQEAGDRIRAYEKKKWVDRYYLLSEKATEKEDEFLAFLLFDCYAGFCSPSLAELKKHHEQKYEAIQFLRPYLEIKIKADHGFGNADTFHSGIRSLGNYVLLSKKSQRTLEDEEQQFGTLPPNEINRIISQLAINPNIEMHKFSNEVNRYQIDAREEVIRKIIDERWEIAN
jgi:hypothetical protein